MTKVTGILFLILIVVAMATGSCDPDADRAANGPDIIDEAYALCSAAESAGASDCSVHGWGQYIQVSLHTSVAEARAMCPQIVAILKDKGAKFRNGQNWKLHIVSPFSGDNVLAKCPIR